MKFKKLLYLLFFFSLEIHAGFVAFTMHSRANCGGFNETISWQWLKPQYLMTATQHYYGGTLQCNPVDFWRLTWRSAAYHYNEGYGGWYVTGQHWGLNRNQDPVKLSDSSAVDCRFYDGWWEK